jgi:hypothetical protein
VFEEFKGFCFHFLPGEDYMDKKMSFYNVVHRVKEGVALLMALLFVSVAAAQRSSDVMVNHKVIVNYHDYMVYAEVDSKDTDHKVADDCFYYWYNANDIKKTRGGYDGKLLHGKYTEFYPDKNLKAQGRFNKGVKTGTWKSWHTNGQYKEVVHWRSGGRRGKFSLYDESGYLVRKGQYRDERYHGVIIESGTDGVAVKRNYYNGREIIKVKKDTLKAKPEKRRWFRFKRKQVGKDTVTRSLEPLQKPAIPKETPAKGKTKKERKKKDEVPKGEAQPVIPEVQKRKRSDSSKL